MQIILAIVADHQQASQLAALIKSRLSVDLIQAAEAGEALLALDNRIPDLVLTSPLMSPFDDGVLDEYLRGLGSAGAHVQTLRIPVLKQAPKKTARLGFSLRRKAKPEPALEGCDPKVFADEIAQYLVRAAEDKQHASSNSPVQVAQEPAANDQWPASAHDAEPDAVSYEQYGNANARDVEPAGPVTEYAVPYEPYVERHQEAEPAAPAPVEYVEPAAAEYVPPAVVEYAEPATADYVEPAAAQYEEPAVAEYVAPAASEYVEPEPAAAEYIVSAPEPLPAAPPEPIPAKPLETVTPRVTKAAERAAVAKADTTSVEAPVVLAEAPPAEGAEAESHKTPSFKAALAAIRAAWGKPAPATAGAPDQKSPAEPPPAAKPAEPAAAKPVVLAPRASAPPASVPEPPSSANSRKTLEAGVNGSEETEEVYEISVEPDMSELESQLITPPKPQARRETAPIEDRRPAGPPAGKRKKGKRSFAPAKARPPRPDPPAQGQPAPGEPVQDEWGIFDPSQCGFAALVDRLDEVSDDEKPQTPPRKGTKVRVISYT